MKRNLQTAVLMAIVAFLLQFAWQTAHGSDTLKHSAAIGDSMSEVKQLMGKPPAEGKIGRNTIWIYPAVELEFYDGKVVAIKRPGEPLKTVGRPPDGPASKKVAAPAPVEKKPASVRTHDSLAKLPRRFVDLAGNEFIINGSLTKPDAVSRTGSFPYRITGSVLRVAKDTDGIATKVISGTMDVKLFDDTGQMVLGIQVPLTSMFPGAGWRGGCFGEASKAGVYTAVVTYECEGQNMIGHAVKAELK